MDRKKPNRGVQSFTKTVPLKAGETCQSLRDHYRYCAREVVGYLESVLTLRPDPERFVFVGVPRIVEHCNKYRKQKQPYSRRQVNYVLTLLRGQRVLVDAERYRRGALRHGWILAPHNAVTVVENGCCDLIGQRHWERQIETEPDPDNPGQRRLKKGGIGPVLWPESSGSPAPASDALAVPSHSTGNAVASATLQPGSSPTQPTLSPRSTVVERTLNGITAPDSVVLQPTVQPAVQGSVQGKTPSVQADVQGEGCTFRAQTHEDEITCETAAIPSRGQPCKTTVETVTTGLTAPDKTVSGAVVSLHTTDQNQTPETIAQHFALGGTSLGEITNRELEENENTDYFDKPDLKTLTDLCDVVIQEWGRRYYLGLKTHGDIMAEAMLRFRKQTGANAPKYWYPIVKRLREWPAEKNFVDPNDEIAELRKLFSDHPECPDCHYRHPGGPCGAGRVTATLENGVVKFYPPPGESWKDPSIGLPMNERLKKP